MCWKISYCFTYRSISFKAYHILYVQSLNWDWLVFVNFLEKWHDLNKTHLPLINAQFYNCRNVWLKRDWLKLLAKKLNVRARALSIINHITIDLSL